MGAESEQARLYMRRLHEMLAACHLMALPDLEDALLTRLTTFEAEAKAAGASKETLGAISNARFTASITSLHLCIPMLHGH